MRVKREGRSSKATQTRLTIELTIGGLGGLPRRGQSTDRIHRHDSIVAYARRWGQHCHGHLDIQPLQPAHVRIVGDASRATQLGPAVRNGFSYR